MTKRRQTKEALKGVTVREVVHLIKESVQGSTISIFGVAPLHTSHLSIVKL